MSENTPVVHCTTHHYDIYIGRGSKWGNPFVIGKDGDRTAVIRKYRLWLRDQPELLADIGELRGRRLGCWCKPRACHGDFLAFLADTLPDMLDVRIDPSTPQGDS